jgi:ABC-2 type transport system ATP-binding protein
MQDTPVLTTQRLTKNYGELTALENLSISLDRGRILGLIGPNGAGKTTAIRILVGQVRPTSGSARIAGCDCVRDCKKIKRLVGYMPELFGSYDNLRVHEYLDFFGAAYGIPRRLRVDRIGDVMETANCHSLRDRYVESLSHGMKQRIAIARTLLHDPELLILDEPGNGLDPQARIEMRQLLLRLASAGKTLIVTSHILPELSRICDQVAILNRGRLRAFGTPEEIMGMVNERRLMEVQLVSGGQVGHAAELIRRHVEEDAEIIASAAESIVRFRTGQSDQGLAGLLASLVREGAEVSQFREVPSDLEESFLHIMRAEETSGESPLHSAAGDPQPEKRPSSE